MPIGRSSRAKYANGRNFPGSFRSIQSSLLISVWVLVFTGSVMTAYYKYPRLFLNHGLLPEAQIPMTPEHAHYLRNVLRSQEGDRVRIFNGREGEWLCSIVEIGKKKGVFKVEERIREQVDPDFSAHLVFAPIKKQRMDVMIEKAVELGVTHLHPVLTNRTENRRFNTEKARAHIIEAAEQCERLDVPVLSDIMDFKAFVVGWSGKTILACIEREEAPHLSDFLGKGDAVFLIGPEGGFDEGEIELMGHADCIQAVSLGKEILRAETAGIFCLSALKFCLR